MISGVRQRPLMGWKRGGAGLAPAAPALLSSPCFLPNARTSFELFCSTAHTQRAVTNAAGAGTSGERKEPALGEDGPHQLEVK